MARNILEDFTEYCAPITWRYHADRFTVVCAICTIQLLFQLCHLELFLMLPFNFLSFTDNTLSYGGPHMTQAGQSDRSRAQQNKQLVEFPRNIKPWMSCCSSFFFPLCLLPRCVYPAREQAGESRAKVRRGGSGHIVADRRLSEEHTSTGSYNTCRVKAVLHETERCDLKKKGGGG